MKTPSAAAEDIPSRVITLEVSLVEAMRLSECVEYYCRTAPNHFDCTPHSHDLRDLIRTLRAVLKEADPEWSKMMHDSPPPEPKEPSKVVVREVHHHHYHPVRPNRNPH